MSKRATIGEAARGAGVGVLGLLGGGIVIVAVAAGLATDQPAKNFSQHAGFAEYYAANPPRSEPPDTAEQALLRRFMPHVFLPPDDPGLVSFYDDYIAQGSLYDGEGRLVSANVTRALLNAHKADPSVTFVHEPAEATSWPVVQARIDRDEVTFPIPDGSVKQIEFTFLTYNLVFRTSGLPAGLPRWLLRLADTFASATDWHQLDHYTALTMVLDESRDPVAVMLQQHHFVRTFIVGLDITLQPDGRAAVDVAIGSNELYPHEPSPTERRAVGTMSADALTYLITGEDAPLLSFDDVTHGVREARYELGFLPPDDAFYRFEGWLGARRWLPGRDGPPGADYNTWPAFKPPGVQLLASYWGQGADAVLTDDGLAEGTLDAAMSSVLAERFWIDWRRAAED